MLLLDLSKTDPRILFAFKEGNEFFLCSTCGIKITEKQYLFCVINDKTFHSFTNPAGFIYNILTFKHCESYREISYPEHRDSWFPGYNWIIINCLNCNNLLGWKYIFAIDIQNYFFGIIREHITLS